MHGPMNVKLAILIRLLSACIGMSWCDHYLFEFCEKLPQSTLNDIVNTKRAICVYFNVYNTKELCTTNGKLGIILILYGMVLICLSIILLFSSIHFHKNVCNVT